MPYERDYITNWSFDILASCSIFLFPRIFSVLDHYRYFSQLIIAFRFVPLNNLSKRKLMHSQCHGGRYDCVVGFDCHQLLRFLRGLHFQLSQGTFVCTGCFICSVPDGDGIYASCMYHRWMFLARLLTFCVPGMGDLG